MIRSLFRSIAVFAAMAAAAASTGKASAEECPYNLAYLGDALVVYPLMDSNTIWKPIDEMIAQAGGPEQAVSSLSEQIKSIEIVAMQARENARRTYAAKGDGLDKLCLSGVTDVKKISKTPEMYCASNYAYHTMVESIVIMKEAIAAIECRSSGEMNHTTYSAPALPKPADTENAQETLRTKPYAEARKFFAESKSTRLGDVPSFFGALQTALRQVAPLPPNAVPTQSRGAYGKSCDQEGAPPSCHACQSGACGVGQATDAQSVGLSYRPENAEEIRQIATRRIKIHQCIDTATAAISACRETHGTTSENWSAFTACFRTAMTAANGCASEQAFLVEETTLENGRQRIRWQIAPEVFQSLNPASLKPKS